MSWLSFAYVFANDITVVGLESQAGPVELESVSEMPDISALADQTISAATIGDGSPVATVEEETDVGCC